MKRKTANPIEDAEIQQKDGESPVAYALRIVEMNRRLAQASGRAIAIGKKSLVRKKRELRKRLENSFGAMRKGSDPPVDTTAPAYVEHMRRIAQRREEEFEKGPMRWMASLFATAERIRRDPEYKKDLKSAQDLGMDLNSRMVKPHKGRAGRAARQEGKITKREQAIALLRKGHTQVEIGKLIDCDPRTVRRYLNGR